MNEEETRIRIRPDDLVIDTTRLSDSFERIIELGTELHRVVASTSKEKIKKEPFMRFREEYIIQDNKDAEEDETQSYVKLYITEQMQYRFEHHVVIYDNDEIVQVENLYEEDWDNLKFKFLFGSVNFAEFDIEYENFVKLFVKGGSDYNDENVCVRIPIEFYEDVKRCLLYLNCEITEDENKDATLKKIEYDAIDYSFKGEPTEEEIEQMISLVDLKTFNQIIKVRMEQDKTPEHITKITEKWAKEYLKQWAYSKYRFYKIFGNSLTLENEIEVSMTEQEAENIKNGLIAKFPLYHPIFAYVHRDAILNNSIRGAGSGNIASNFFKDSKVKRNMSFTKFISLFNCEELNIEVSKIYQNKGTAHITISINPIDYLTASINTSGWRSCHNFIDGEYRNATLSYMFDKTSLVSFRSKGLEPYSIGRKKFEWNSKSWRQMVYVSEDSSSMVFSRQYPNSNDELSKGVREMLEKEISNFYGGCHKWKKFIHVKKANMLVTGHHLLYNDVEHGSNHVVVKAKDDVKFNEPQTIHIGSEEVKSINMEKNLEGGRDRIWQS